MKMAVLASGYGSNLQAIMDAVDRGQITGSLELVLSDNQNAYALERAKNNGIEALYLDPDDYENRIAYDKALVARLQEKKIELVILAGFMRVLSPVFIKEYRGRIMNIHPSLLPAFPGVNGVGQALAYGVKVSGCSVHFVDEGLDEGPIILQEAVPVFDHDTEESLQQRIHEVEHRLYPRAIQLFIEGKLRLEGRKCLINEN
ncbi:MAG: phosphoribosylglycinamide formyltransferase [Dethiobacteria bacterium]|jgi:phosphoribosylglycinamide formyltransferase-1